ncbi:MAG: peptidase [Proteobacteria bacterium]|nr:peptidase [Pseudomonadota bacterium]
MPQAAPAAKPLHIFKPGRWTTMHGESIEFSEADLQAAAQAYDPTISKAPLVVGHPKTDDPAKGWAVSLSATERGLYATADKVDPEFAEAVRRGAYGTVSAKFYRPTDPNNPAPGAWYLRHIGFLGAQPPAVKGLDAPEFAAADDDGCVCFQEGVAFGEWDAATSAGLWRRLRDWMVDKFGMDEADKVLPNYSVHALELGAQDDIAAPAFADGSPTTTTHTTDQPPQESAVTDQEAAQLRDQNAALQRQNEELRRAAHERAFDSIRQDNVAFAENMVSQARIPAAMKDQVAAIGAQLQSTPDVEFGEGDAKKPMHQVFRDLLAALPPAVEFGETATRERAAQDAQDANDGPAFAEADPERLAQHNKALAYAKQHGVPYAQAAAAVIK